MGRAAEGCGFPVKRTFNMAALRPRRFRTTCALPTVSWRDRSDVPAKHEPLEWKSWSADFWHATVGQAGDSLDYLQTLQHKASAPMLQRLQACFFSGGEVLVRGRRSHVHAQSALDLIDLVAHGFIPDDRALAAFFAALEGYVDARHVQHRCISGMHALEASGVDNEITASCQSAMAALAQVRLDPLRPPTGLEAARVACTTATALYDPAASASEKQAIWRFCTDETTLALHRAPLSQ